MMAELELELIQPHMAQKPMLRGEVGCACVARDGRLSPVGASTVDLSPPSGVPPETFYSPQLVSRLLWWLIYAA